MIKYRAKAIYPWNFDLDCGVPHSSGVLARSLALQKESKDKQYYVGTIQMVSTVESLSYTTKISARLDM